MASFGNILALGRQNSNSKPGLVRVRIAYQYDFEERNMSATERAA